MKIIVTIIPTYLVTNLLLSPFFSFLTNQKQESGFQQVGGLVTRNIFFVKEFQDFYKGLFLHVTPIRIIVPC